MDIPNYAKMTVAELKICAKDRGVLHGSSIKKAQLVEYLINSHVDEKIRNENIKRVENEKRKNQKNTVAHRKTRVTELRQQSDIRPEALEYPFLCLQQGYCGYEATPKSIPGQESVDIGDFPNNIQHYYWIHEGINDEEPWMTLCRLTNGAYVFYKGECDYTGFECRGNMEMYSSMDPAILITYALSIRDYDAYIKDTQ